ncbi:SDR family oxidoreductase [Simiduia aestuariiviva]|uniref:3-oxoacyl-[acyl-carrier protein] reductase n=1 Tax=Simiduia aestuariiviva TaxID=1510459 RepID=A0A839UNE5_9GAMM|nr:SDR family NAD(P)-dependent oxidoreductase [Simiduia aestuariiviva]MBB3166967.1 3-oxoacyl-[acyl-carrier protein] reductase [Simiduia aestuariiviva]
MHPAFDFNGQTALITGAGNPNGIGFACARLLAELGAKVLISATGKHVFDRQAELRALGFDAFGYVIDLTDRPATDALAQQLGDQHGAIHILINNAGMTQQGQSDADVAFSALDPTDWDLSIARNLTTCFNITHALVPQMLASQYGRIVNISSVTGPLVSNAREAAYSAAKAAMVGMSRSLAIELGPHITVNNVAPGWVATDSQTPSEARAGQHCPAGRSGHADEIAHATVFLASPGASYITGQMLVVDGGNCLQETKGA